MKKQISHFSLKSGRSNSGDFYRAKPSSGRRVMKNILKKKNERYAYLCI